MTSSKTIIIAFPIANSAVSDYFRSLSLELVHRGYFLVIITPGKRIESQSSNPAVYCWPSKRPTRFQDALFLAKIIKKYKPVLIMSNFAAVNICILVSFLMGVPLRMARYHTSFDRYLSTQKGKKILIDLQIFRKEIVYKFATMVLPVAEAMSLELNHIYKVPRKKIKCFHNALEDSHVLNSSINHSGKKLMCVGRLTFGKGQDILIKAMSIVKKNFPEVKLQIIGGGEYASELLSLVDSLELSSSIEFIGQIPHDRIISQMADAYAVVVPSRFEAFSYVIIEAMSAGVPVIASAVGGIPEIVRDRVDGFLVPPENPEILAEHIMEMLNNQELRKTMGKNARDRFLENFELRKAVMNEADWLEKQINLKMGL